jgi:hypothetical protein
MGGIFRSRRWNTFEKREREKERERKKGGSGKRVVPFI